MHVHQSPTAPTEARGANLSHAGVPVNASMAGAVIEVPLGVLLPGERVAELQERVTVRAGFGSRYLLPRVAA